MEAIPGRMAGTLRDNDVIAVKPNKEDADIQGERVIDAFSSFLWTCWVAAKDEKDTYEDQLLVNMRQRAGIYEAQKLSAIRQMGGAEVYLMVTDMKCVSCEAWIKDILIQPSGELPYDISPSPIAEIPSDIKTEIESEIFKEAMQMAVAESVMSKGQINPLEVFAGIMEQMPEIKEDIQKAIQVEAAKTSKKMKRKMDDQFTEGKLLAALESSIPDIVMGTGFIKGPIQQKRFVRRPTREKSGVIRIKIAEEIYPTYSSPSPFDIYPAPGANGIQDGYMFERLRMTPRELQDCIGLPGYQEDVIREVLKEYNDGQLGDWLNLEVDREVEAIKIKSGDGSSGTTYGHSKIDVLLFWGAVSGQDLLDWGMSPKDVDDADKHYDVYAYYVNKKIICARMNRNFAGEKPYSKASFRTRKNQYWGQGLPESIADIQGVANACVRAIVNNIGIASGPQVERNIDRIPKESLDDDAMYPWKIWDVTNEQMGNSAPALKFYQPAMVVDKIMNALKMFLQLADEHSMIPSYAHGDPNVGGVGRTASGLNMLMQGASRGIKNIIKDIDSFMIVPVVERQYYWNIENEENYGLVADFQIVAKGSAALMAKEQQTTRRLEYLAQTNNPIDVQLIGVGGRKYMLRDTAESMGWDADKVFGAEKDEKMQAIEAASMDQMTRGSGTSGGTPPPAKPAMLDQAGAPVQGQDLNPNPNGRGV
jgi:hypothetical protein